VPPANPFISNCFIDSCAFDVQLTAGEVRKLREIEAILAGNGKIENIVQDARHIFEAQKYGSYFITTDSRILDRASKLRSATNVAIVSQANS
jgi:ribosome biogenesis protein Tsr3